MGGDVDDIDKLGILDVRRAECRITLGFDDSKGVARYRVEFGYSSPGGLEWSRTKKYGKTKRERAVSILRRSGVFEVESSEGDDVITIVASCSVDGWTPSAVSKIAEVVAEAGSALAFTGP